MSPVSPTLKSLHKSGDKDWAQKIIDRVANGEIVCDLAERWARDVVGPEASDDEVSNA